jgi:hypothetical protein
MIGGLDEGLSTNRLAKFKFFAPYIRNVKGILHFARSFQFLMKHFVSLFLSKQNFVCIY